MNRAFVVQEKNIKSAVEPYKKDMIDRIKIKIRADDIKIFFLDLKIWSKLLPEEFKELRFSKLSIKPLFLPIFKNLFFLSL